MNKSSSPQTFIINSKNKFIKKWNIIMYIVWYGYMERTNKQTKNTEQKLNKWCLYIFFLFLFFFSRKIKNNNYNIISKQRQVLWNGVHWINREVRKWRGSFPVWILIEIFLKLEITKKNQKKIFLSKMNSYKHFRNKIFDSWSH